MEAAVDPFATFSSSFDARLADSRNVEFSWGQDRATAVPDGKVLLENECVRLQFYDVKVGEKTPLHSHPSYVAYVFSPYRASFIPAEGSVKRVERKACDGFFIGPVTHSVEKLGNTPIHNLFVELKGGEAPSAERRQRNDRLQ